MDALSPRDLSRLIALSDPEIEWHSFFAELGGGGVYRGHSGTRRYIDDLGKPGRSCAPMWTPVSASAR